MIFLTIVMVNLCNFGDSSDFGIQRDKTFPSCKKWSLGQLK